MKFIYFILRKIGNAGPRFKHLNRVNFILKGKIHSLRIQFKMMDVYAPCYIRTNARRVELKFIIRVPFGFEKKKKYRHGCHFWASDRKPFGLFLTVGHLNPSKSSSLTSFDFFFKKNIYSN